MREQGKDSSLVKIVPQLPGCDRLCPVRREVGKPPPALLDGYTLPQQKGRKLVKAGGLGKCLPYRPAQLRLVRFKLDLLEELPANLVNRILDTVSPSDRTLINQLLNYPEDSAGSIMTTEYVDIRQSMTVAQSMAHIKETGIHKETIYTCYVTDKRKLIGIVSAKDLMTTDDGILISELMETEIISVRTYTDKEEVAQLFRKYDLLALPVLDKDGLMVGIVTFVSL